MTELTLRRGSALEAGIAFLSRLLKEMFSATPLGIALAACEAKR